MAVIGDRDRYIKGGGLRSGSHDSGIITNPKVVYNQASGLYTGAGTALGEDSHI